MNKEDLIKKLSYISKSKKSLFDMCPFAFKLKYLDKVPQEDNPYFILGTDVHEFIENFFKIVKIKDGEIAGLNDMQFHPNTEYKKNVARLELERFEKIKEKNLDESFFFPMFNEKQWITESPKLIGIVDRVHKCHTEDVFAPTHPEFKDGDLVIIENKTGKPTAEKCLKYEKEFLWYKILLEIMHPELSPINWGTIYFPYDNHRHFVKLKDEDCRELAKEIKDTRDKILNCITSDIWDFTPNVKTCKDCDVKKYCERGKNV